MRQSPPFAHLVSGVVDMLLKALAQGPPLKAAARAIPAIANLLQQAGLVAPGRLPEVEALLTEIIIHADL